MAAVPGRDGAGTAGAAAAVSGAAAAAAAAAEVISALRMAAAKETLAVVGKEALVAVGRGG